MNIVFASGRLPAMSLIGRAESRLLRLSLVLITLLMAQPAAADVADGVRAFRARNYATAYRLLLPAAEAGDREEQYWLSMVLDIGTGIGGSSKEANRSEEHTSELQSLMRNS